VVNKKYGAQKNYDEGNARIRKFFGLAFLKSPEGYEPAKKNSK
jgi:hypothetical protein